MKVYLVFLGKNWEGGTIDSAYSSREEAEGFAQKIRDQYGKDGYRHLYVEVQEFEIQ